MGCANTNVEDFKPQIRDVGVRDNEIIDENNFEPYLQSKINPSFNFPEVDEEKYIGTGIKKIKGYISNISEEELLKKRKEFWETRIEGNPETWNFLKEICENKDSDDNNILAYLQACDIVPYKSCINVTYDQNGFLYEIPNYCIQDPYKYNVPKEDKEKSKKQNIVFFIWKEGKIIEIKNNNYLSVSDLKNLLSQQFNFDKEKIRLFFGGKELKDEKELWYYNIISGCTVMSMFMK